MDCHLCSKRIPLERLKSPFLKPGHPKRAKYCSVKCNQRAWIIKTGANKSNHFNQLTKNEWTKSTTGLAFFWEQYVSKVLGGVWQGFGAPFDVLADNEKIDVKVASLYRRKKRRGLPVSNPQSGVWTFHKSPIQKDIDFLYCIGLDKGKKVKEWKIPYDEAPVHMTLGRKSKWDRYTV